MATAASSSTSNTHSPRHRRNSRRALHRVESEAVPAPEPSDGPSSPILHHQHSEITDRQDDAAVAAATAAVHEKKSAWSKPSNGVVDVGPVMGAVSWPALSEAARASPKSLSSESLVALSDGSVSSPALSVVANPPPKPVLSNPNPNAASNHTPARQKSTRRGSGGAGGSVNNNNSSGGGALANGASFPVSPPVSVGISTKTASDRPSVREPSPKEHPNRGSSSWDHGSRSGGFLPQNHSGNEHHRNYNHRRGNTGGGGSDGGNFHYNNYSTRRNHDRGGYEWNTNRNFPGRDIPFHQPHPPRLPQRSFIIPQPVSAPFICPSPTVRPYGNLMGFHDMNPPFVYMPGPLVPPSMFYQIPDPNLSNSLLRQIEYYFSPENLCKDIFLRQNMEKEGWVSISIIANFNRIKMLTDNSNLILDTVRTSSLLEVMGDKIRRRNDWANWLLPPAASQSIIASDPETPPRAIYDPLATRFDNMVLETETINHDSVRSAQSVLVLDRSSSGEFNKQPQATGNRAGEGSGKGSGQMG